MGGVEVIARLNTKQTLNLIKEVVVFFQGKFGIWKTCEWEGRFSTVKFEIFLNGIFV